MAAEITVGDRALVVSPHALVRYIERVKPAFDPALALMDLRRVLGHAEFQEAGPDWAVDDGRATAWIVLGDAIAFPVAGRTLVTCLTRSFPGDDLRASLDDRRPKQVAERRQTAARQSKRGRFARDARRRARARREGMG